MLRCCYVILRRHCDVPIRRRGDVPLRRLGDVSSRLCWVFHLGRICDVAGTEIETLLRRRHNVLMPGGALMLTNAIKFFKKEIFIVNCQAQLA